MIKMKSSIIHLCPETVSKLQEKSVAMKYQVEVDMIYEGHIPIVGILLLFGRIKLYRGRRLKQQLDRGHLLGVRELMQGVPFEYTARICSGSEICYLDKSTILELLQHEDQELVELISSLQKT
jgi:CRP-like cAMP-binding protein